MKSGRRVVVTGLGVATPIGLGIEPFWDGLVQKSQGIRRVEEFDASGLASSVGGELPAFTFANYIPKTYRKSIKVMARDITIAMICAYHAVTDAQLKTKCLVDRGEVEGPPGVDSRRFGANIGAGLVSADLRELAGALSTAADSQGRFSLARWGEEGMTNLTPLWLLKFLPNMLACHVTIVHDAQAPSNTITCAEASSHLAIGEAYRTIARGNADVCICGGAENKISPMSMMRPQLWNHLNTQSNDQPQRSSQPFGANRCGMAAAEGGGLAILESLEHAQARGARIYAELVGFGSATATHSWSTPSGDGSDISMALSKAISDAQTQPGEIDMVVPFGVGTLEHDASEMAGWNSTFGSHLEEIPAMCCRGSVGNNGAGSGAIDFAASVYALYRNTVPPSINTDSLDADCRFQFVQNQPSDAPIRQAITLGYAMAGGQRAALVIRRYVE